ncbi:MAG: M28 family peptidase [Methylohalobius sp.]|nr:M28 family peptidase [Methylohalobius sp.]
MTLPALAEALRRHVEYLAGEIGERNVFHPQALQAAENYLAQTWHDLGLEVQRQVYEAKGVASANLEVTLPGRTWPHEIVLLGAHYDSVQGSPGANDNGSGVAVLLALSQLLQSFSLPRTVRLVAFVNEEPPFFFTSKQGSRQYAKMARARGDNIRLMLSLETMGYYCDRPGCQRYPPLFRFFYPATGHFIGFVTCFKYRRQLRRLTHLFRAVCDFPVEQAAAFAWIPGVAWSDHLSFWRYGYPGIMVTDTALFRYPWYHHPEDTPDKLDYTRLARVTEGLASAIHQLTVEGI